MWRLWSGLSTRSPSQQLGKSTRSWSGRPPVHARTTGERPVAPTPPHVHQTFVVGCRCIAIESPAIILRPAGKRWIGSYVRFT
jgi:hypothetical protein